MKTSLEAVLRHPGIWRGDQCAQTPPSTLPSEHAALDALLPGGGWPRGALTELLFAHQGIGELRLLAPALARLSQDSAWLAWVAPPHMPHAPALAAAGIDLKRLLIAQPQATADAWWTAEQALRSGACGAVLAWLHAADERRLRRLQLAAETGQSWAVLFRHARAAQERSPAALRLLLEPSAGGLAIHILKRRGGPVGQPILLRLAQDRATRHAHPLLATPARRRALA